MLLLFSKKITNIKNLFLLIFMFSFLSVNVTLVFAEDEAKDPIIRLNNAQIIEALVNKTLWYELEADRIFFDDENNFVLQTSEVYDGIGSGILEGNYTITSDGKLCLVFSQSNKTICYLVTYDPNEPRPWYIYDDPLTFQVITSENTASENNLNFNRWMHGNLILNPEFHRNFKSTIASLSEMDTKTKDFLRGDFAPLPALEMTNYLQVIAGKISVYPLGAAYHGLGGAMSFMSVDEALKIRDKLAKIQDSGNDGYWYIDGYKHCWVFTLDNIDGRTNCNLADYGGHTLLNPVESSIVLHTQNGFTRVVTPDDIIDPSKP